MTRLVIGIDPGLTGAVSMIREGHSEVHDMPAMAAGQSYGSVKTQINPAALADLMKELTSGERDDAIAVVEKVDGYIDHKAAIFSMGNSFGCIRGVLGALRIPVHIVRPVDWKKHFGLPRDKEYARTKAIELYPSLELSKKKHHNRAEALLIARYGWEVLR